MPRLCGIFCISIFFIFIIAISVCAQKNLSIADQKFKERHMYKADLICVGRVISIIPAPLDLLQREYDPDWQIAAVEVSDTFVGEIGKNDKIQVIFPNSTNLMWPGRPNISPGREYVFILQDLKLYEHLPRKEIGEGEYYMAIHPARIQPKIRAAKIKMMIDH